MTKAYRVMVGGRVQGVGFRYHVQTRAFAHGIFGWVRNTPDGKVEAHLEGDEEKVRQFIAWMWEGPPMAQVDSIAEIEAAPKRFTSFEVRH